MDEFDGSWCRPGELKRLVNHLPLTVETKGGHRQFRAEYVFITSNWSPLGWWKNPKPQDIDPIRRRITAEFQHVHTNAVLGGRTLPVVLVNLVKGRWHMHPLFRYLVDCPELGLVGTKRLNVDALGEQLDTQEGSTHEEARFSQLYGV